MNAEKIYKKNNTQVTLSELLVLMVSDIDIFLLKEENQIDDKNIMYSADDIRKQLKATLSKVLNLYMQDVFPILDTPIYKAVKVYQVHTNNVLSDKEKKEIIAEIINSNENNF